MLGKQRPGIRQVTVGKTIAQPGSPAGGNSYLILGVSAWGEVQALVCIPERDQCLFGNAHMGCTELSQDNAFAVPSMSPMLHGVTSHQALERKAKNDNRRITVRYVSRRFHSDTHQRDGHE